MRHLKRHILKFCIKITFLLTPVYVYGQVPSSLPNQVKLILLDSIKHINKHVEKIQTDYNKLSLELTNSNYRADFLEATLRRYLVDNSYLINKKNDMEAILEKNLRANILEKEVSTKVSELLKLVKDVLEESNNKTDQLVSQMELNGYDTSVDLVKSSVSSIFVDQKSFQTPKINAKRKPQKPKIIENTNITNENQKFDLYFGFGAGPHYSGIGLNLEGKLGRNVGIFLGSSSGYLPKINDIEGVFTSIELGVFFLRDWNISFMKHFNVKQISGVNYARVYSINLQYYYSLPFNKQFSISIGTGGTYTYTNEGVRSIINGSLGFQYQLIKL